MRAARARWASVASADDERDRYDDRRPPPRRDDPRYDDRRGYDDRYDRGPPPPRYDDRRYDDRGGYDRGGYDRGRGGNGGGNGDQRTDDFSRSVESRYPGEWRHGFERAPEDTGRVDLDKVNFILSQRVEAKRASDFPAADRLRDQLRDELGVTVMDRDRLWWCTSGQRDGGRRFFGATSHDYSRTDDLPGVDVETIDQMLAQRLQARLTRDFVAADNLRSELMRMGVQIDDKARTWTADRSAQPAGYAGGYDDERENGDRRRADDGGYDGYADEN